MYRFGDGTPFPLRENFIETLVAAVDCCVALYQVEARIEEHHARVREAARRAADELQRLDALNSLLETSLAPLLARQGQDQTDARASEQAAAKIVESAAGIIRNSRTGVARKRDGISRETVPRAVLEAVPAALGRFLGRHQLPRTEWHAHWRATGEQAGSAELIAQSTRHLELVFNATFADGFWARPIPLAELTGGPLIATVEAGKGRPRQLRLDSTLLTEVQVAPGREAMVLRDTGKRPGSGYHILMPRPGEAGPLVVALDRRDQSRGQPFYLDQVAAADVLAVWRALEREMPSLVAGRQELAAARLGGRAVSELEHPAQLAEAILLSLGSLVREMRVRSRVPGELILKRDLAPDRREELFVPRQVLWNKVAALPPRHRQLFEAIGLGNEVTHEFVSRVSEKPVTTRKRAAQGSGSKEQPDLPTTESYGFDRDPDLIDTGVSRAGPSSPPEPAAGPASEASAGATEREPERDEDSDGESGVELTNPRREDTSEVVSGIIERASA
jgi:hypothetical protein